MTSRFDQKNVGPKEKWASLIGGGVLTGLGVSSRSWAGLGLAAVGGALIWRGATRHCPLKSAIDQKGPVRIERTFTVANKTPEEVYEFWRNLENLPNVIHQLQSVKPLDDRRSHWVAKGPAGVPVEWDAEIVKERSGHSIEWRSLPGSVLTTSGIVRFKKKHGQGTKVHLSMRYLAPGGAVGQVMANLLGQRAEQKVDSGIRGVQEALAHS